MIIRRSFCLIGSLRYFVTIFPIGIRTYLLDLSRRLRSLELTRTFACTAALRLTMPPSERKLSVSPKVRTLAALSWATMGLKLARGGKHKDYRQPDAC